ncbi:hypothetical protein G4V62_13365 [Bacillaceae bacterium SIJ1]|uniref:hypothetical protein n=1 Tax=Litoribacterium kuwaitense TaxID=1398745 RepID=UPI0013ED953F|nr:hypothetical protein [Litoribacterium kuwaitense]NGP45886.1 hypothetical protein [Litoribacterium kuwaitense]
MRLYLQTMKKNVFLFLITVVLLVLTAGFWLGLPFMALTEANVPAWLQVIFIGLGIGFCFSLFFIPLHLSFAKDVGTKKRENKVKTFFLVQGALMTFVATVVALFILIAKTFSTY